MKTHLYYTYILTNKNKTVLYTGVTNNLVRRCFEHKNKVNKGFTSRYNVDCLIYFEIFDFITVAIKREKQLKGYSRIKKINLVNQLNPGWYDLYNNGTIEIPDYASEPGIQQSN